MSKIIPSEYRIYLSRLPEFPEIYPKALENKGSDEDILTVYAILKTFKPERFLRNRVAIAKLVNSLISRGLYEYAREALREFEASDVAKAIIIRALTSYKPKELEPIIESLAAIDEEAMRKVLAPEFIRSSRDKELLELSKKLVTPKNLESWLRVIREAFYATEDEEAIKLLVNRLQRYKDYDYMILSALVDVRPEPDREKINKLLGKEDYIRLVLAGGRSKRVLEKIRGAIIEALHLGRIGQYLRDYPELRPVGEYILENKLRLEIPEDERRGTFLRALHFFPTLRGYGEKMLNLLADAIKYAIEREDRHLLRIAVSQLSEIDVHPRLKARVIREALRGIEESDRFFDALDTILRYLKYDPQLASEIVKVVAETLPDVRAILAVFGDALSALLSSPAAYEVVETLIEAKPNDKALGELLGMIRDERARVRAAVKIGEDISSLDPYKVLLYASDLIDDKTLLELLKRASVDEKLLHVVKRAIEAESKENIDRIVEKIRGIPIEKAASIYIIAAAKTGREEFLRPLLEAQEISIDYETAETLALLAKKFKLAEEIIKRFISDDAIISALATIYHGDKKLLEFADELSRHNKDAAVTLIARGFEGTNDLDAAKKVLELSGRDLEALVRIAPDALYVEPLYDNVRKILEEFI